jgi:hypothetical protein
MSAQQDAGFYEAEMHGAIAEVDPETCKDVMKEMEEWKPKIEKTYSQKLMSEVKSGPRGQHINLQPLSGRAKRAENGCQDRHATSVRRSRAKTSLSSQAWTFRLLPRDQ